jgi:tRNA(His) guanylyltransferase
MKDSLGDRMKGYEQQYSSQKLLNLIPLCARIDGRAFHTFTHGLPRPYDKRLSDLMVATTKYLVEETGATVGYTQSDEISLIWYTDSPKVQHFFDRSLLKMVSILSSMTTGYFSRHLDAAIPERAGYLATFDARVWNVPVLFEATNYLIWREMDATRNSVSMAAQSCYSHKELHGKSSSEKHELLFKKGINWNDYPVFFKRGTYVRRSHVDRPFTTEEIALLPEKHAARINPELVVRRQTIGVVEWPPLSKIKNRTEVVFGDAEPELGELDGTVA